MFEYPTFGDRPFCRLIDGVRVVYLEDGPWYALCDVSAVIGFTCADYFKWVDKSNLHKIQVPGKGCTYSKRSASYVADSYDLKIIAQRVADQTAKEWIPEWAEDLCNEASSEVVSYKPPLSKEEIYAKEMPLEATSDSLNEEEQLVLAQGIKVAKSKIDKLEAENLAIREELSFIGHRLACAAEVIPAAEHYLAGMKDAFNVVGKTTSCLRTIPALADSSIEIKEISKQLLCMAEGGDEQ